MQVPETIPVVEQPTVYQQLPIETQRTVINQEQQPVVVPSAPSVIIRTIYSNVRMIFLNNKFIIYF
jgi:hypothetical protein